MPSRLYVVQRSDGAVRVWIEGGVLLGVPARPLPRPRGAQRWLPPWPSCLSLAARSYVREQQRRSTPRRPRRSSCPRV